MNLNSFDSSGQISWLNPAIRQTANDPFMSEGTPDGYRAAYGTYSHQTNQVHWLRIMAAEVLKKTSKRN